MGRSISQDHGTKISRPSASFMVNWTQFKFTNHQCLRFQIKTLCLENEVFGIMSSLQNIRSFNFMIKFDSRVKFINRT